MNFNIYPKSKNFVLFLTYGEELTGDAFFFLSESLLILLSFFSTILSTLCKWVRFPIVIVKRIKDEIYLCPWTAIVGSEL